MTQITLNISNPASARAIRAIARAMEGVSIQRSRKINRKNGLELALEDIDNGNITHWDSPEALINHINAL